MTSTAIVTRLAEINFSSGLPGFAHHRRFRLAPVDSSDGRFFEMVSQDDESLAFVVASPWTFHPDYQLDLDDESAARLGLEDSADAVVLCIVADAHDLDSATINLLGPVVINPETREAFQVSAGGGYDTRVPLLRGAVL